VAPINQPELDGDSTIEVPELVGGQTAEVLAQAVSSDRGEARVREDG